MMSVGASFRCPRFSSEDGSSGQFRNFDSSSSSLGWSAFIGQHFSPERPENTPKHLELRDVKDWRSTANHPCLSQRFAEEATEGNRIIDCLLQPN
jgi:hypothetical protein